VGTSEGDGILRPVRVQAEFTVYPFVEGESLPPHVQAGIDAVRGLDVEVEIGPLSNIIRGEGEAVLEALRIAQAACLAAGGRRIVSVLEIVA
jgi:uncharacterized protein YqgV (UPF0045/DUF77 family)